MIERTRSVLSVPADRWNMVEKSVGLDADVTFFDLEDAVAPSAKEEARLNVTRGLEAFEGTGRTAGFRINGVETPWCYRDVIEVLEGTSARVEFVIVPKVERPAHVHFVATLLDQLEKWTGRKYSVKLQAQIESAEGLLAAPAIARASDRVDALVFGPGDFAASVGAPSTAIGGFGRWDDVYQGHRWHYALSAMLVAARAAGVRAIDGPFSHFRDEGGLRRSCELSRALGYDGKWCIHPAQISIVNDLFSPTPDELQWARGLVSTYEQATAVGSGSVAMDGTMVDAATLKIARRLLARAE